MGGVSKGADAAQMMLAGASAVAVGTAQFADPFAPIRVRDELAGIAAAQGLKSVWELTGGVLPWNTGSCSCCGAAEDGGK